MKTIRFGNSHKFADTISDIVRNTNVTSIDFKYYDRHNIPYVSEIVVIFNDTDKYILECDFDLDKVTSVFISQCKKYVSNLNMLKRTICSYRYAIYNHSILEDFYEIL